MGAFFPWQRDRWCGRVMKRREEHVLLFLTGMKNGVGESVRIDADGRRRSREAYRFYNG